jgi:hypothetical protein
VLSESDKRVAALIAKLRPALRWKTGCELRAWLHRLRWARMQAVWTAHMRHQLLVAKLKALLWRAWNQPVEPGPPSAGPLCVLSGRDGFIMQRASLLARAAELPAAYLRSKGGTWRWRSNEPPHRAAPAAATPAGPPPLNLKVVATSGDSLRISIAWR